MNPAFLDGMSWEMAEVYGAISDQILINLAKYFPYYKPGGKVPKSAFTYQATMLAQMGQVNAETVAIIRRGLKDANSALGGVLEQAIIDSVRTAEKPLYKAVKQGIFSPPLVPIVSPNQTRAFQLYYAQACDKLNLVNTVMLESTGSAYRQAVNDVVSEMQINDRIKKTQTALDIGAGETVSGVSSWNQALRHTVERMKATGITGFVDHAGRHWSAEAYAAMDIRTTVWNTSRAAVWETNQNFGNDLYSVSFHNGARPGCYDWQNRVISSTNNARTVTDLDGNEIYVVAQSDTSYGQAAGLFGVNCKHYPTPFIPGVSIIRGQPQSPEENERTYAESQEQRRLERKLREEKRDIMMAKAQGASDEEIKALQERARNTSQDIDDFCESTGRTRHRDREGVYTQRSFPSKDSYDVSAFETEQRDKQKQFFENSGAQRQYQAGVLNPQTPIVPQQKEFTSISDIDAEIARLRTERQAAFDSDNYDKAKTDKQLQDIFALEDRRKALIAEQEQKALDAGRITERPAKEQDILKRYNRFDVTTRTDAQMLAQVNPNYKEGTRAWIWNCQRTVTAQELIYRGYDVTACPYNAKDPIGDVMGKAWKNPYDGAGYVSIATRKEFVATTEKAFAEWGNGSRAIIRVKWQQKYGGNGHFIFARNVNGSIIYTDPQDGRVLDINETVSHTTQGRNHMWVMRCDNKEVTDAVVYAVKNRGE